MLQIFTLFAGQMCMGPEMVEPAAHHVLQRQQEGLKGIGQKPLQDHTIVEVDDDTTKQDNMGPNGPNNESKFAKESAEKTTKWARARALRRAVEACMRFICPVTTVEWIKSLDLSPQGIMSKVKTTLSYFLGEGTIMNKAITVITNVISTKCKDLVQSVSNKAQETVGWIVDFVKNIKDTVEMAVFGENNKDTIWSVGRSVYDSISNDGLCETAKAYVPAVTQTAVNTVSGIASATVSAATTVGSAAKSAATSAWSAVTSWWSR